MFARGVVSLVIPPLLGRKSFSVKSRVSITSKLIQTKRLQVLYFGHLRKTGGRGELLARSDCSRTAPLPAFRQNSPKSNDSPRYAPLCRKSNVSPTYAKTGGCTPRKMSARRHSCFFPRYFALSCAQLVAPTRGKDTPTRNSQARIAKFARKRWLVRRDRWRVATRGSRISGLRGWRRCYRGG